MSAKGMTLTVLATGLAEAVAKDEKEIEGGHPDCGFDMSAGMFGAHVSAWLREVAASVAPPREQDLAMMIRMLCSHTANPKTRERAMEMLRSYGLLGSPLRG